MITLIKYAVCFVIIFAILLYIYGWVAESEREIAEEKAEKKYRREIENWKQTTQHPLTDIKIIDGEGGGRLIIQGGHENNEKHRGS